MDGKRPADSVVTFVRMMTQADANLAGNVHGGVIMKEIDSARVHDQRRYVYSLWTRNLEHDLVFR